MGGPLASAGPPRAGDSVTEVPSGATGASPAGRVVRLPRNRSDATLSRLFEELDWRPTPIGSLSLRRRLVDGTDVYEIKLGDEFLMSSRFTAAEIELARLGLAGFDRDGLEVVVGGLGLGYTARAVLEQEGVASLLVVEALEGVIAWHEEGLLPLGPGLVADRRCRFVQGDFFALAAAPEVGFDPQAPGRRFDAVLVDIDHSPRALLDAGNAGFYTPEGLGQLSRHLKPGGVFGLWSNEPPDAEFEAVLASVFPASRAEVVRFDNPLQNREAINTVYVASAA